MSKRNRAQQLADRARAEANRTRNSQLLASYAANPSSIPKPGPPKGNPPGLGGIGAAIGPGLGIGPTDGVGGRPLDWQEEQYRLNARRQVSLGDAATTYQRGALEQEYGYGNTGAANPYSRAALLAESFKRSKLGTTNSYAAQGQLHSGAYGRMQNENQRQYSIGADRNRREFDQQVYGLNLDQAQRAASYGIGVDDEAFAALLRALGGK